MPQNSNFRPPRGHRFFAKNGSYGYRSKSRWGLRRVHLGLLGSHWVQKMGQNRKKLPCPKIRIFDYPAVIDFSQKMEFTDMQPNHCGDTLGAILGPIGSHWIQKMGQNRKNYHAPKFEFSTTRGHRFFTKNGIYGYAAKSLWGHPRGHLGANWVPLGPKNGSKPQKITMPPNSNFRLPRGHQFFPKNWTFGYNAKSRWGPPRVHLGANGVPLGPKNGSKP